MKSIGISFYILPGFRGDCLCCLGRHEWKFEKNRSGHSQQIMLVICVRYGIFFLM